MLKYLKTNKLFTILLITTIMVFILGIILSSVIDNQTKEEINNNIYNMINKIKNNDLINTNILNHNNFFSIIIIWILGISIIAIPIVLFIYITKVITVSLELSFLLLNIKKINLLFTILYLLPRIINIFIYFILIYYSINYSLILIKTIFLKKEYRLKSITKKYLKIFILVLISNILNSLLEIFIISKVLIHII